MKCKDHASSNHEWFFGVLLHQLSPLIPLSFAVTAATTAAGASAAAVAHCCTHLCCWRCRYLWLVCFALVLDLLLVLYLCRNCVLAFCASPSLRLLVMLLLLLPSLLYLRVCLHLRP